jgi:hypothetical protein
MFGFFAGALGAYAVYRLVQHRRYGGWHRGGYGGRGGFGSSFFVRRLSERLDATPGQEKVIQEVLESLQQQREAFRGEWDKTRAAASKAVGGEAFDPSALREAWVRHDAALGELRVRIVDGLSKVHEALEPQQRRILAELIETAGGWGMHGRGHGYGHGCGFASWRRHGGWGSYSGHGGYRSGGFSDTGMAA